MSRSSFADDLDRKLDGLHPDASSHLGEIEKLPDSVGREIVAMLFREACESQNVGRIISARNALLSIPPHWLSVTLRDAIDRVVNLGDEWEYRRLLELLGALESELIALYVEYGLASADEAIREAASDFKGGVPRGTV